MIDTEEEIVVQLNSEILGIDILNHNIHAFQMYGIFVWPRLEACFPLRLKEEYLFT